MTTASRPPFDPELAAALAVISEQVPPGITAEMVRQMRSARMDDVPILPVPDDLSLDGAFTEKAHEAPGPDGAPDVSVTVGRPTDAPAPTSALYWIHGGG